MPTYDYRLLLPVLQPRACLRCREREPGRLQLRVILCPRESVYEVIVEESDTRIEVLVLICGDREIGGEPIDCPVHVYLESPLAGREVIDRARDGVPVDEFVPTWCEASEIGPVRIRT